MFPLVCSDHEIEIIAPVVKVRVSLCPNQFLVFGWKVKWRDPKLSRGLLEAPKYSELSSKKTMLKPLFYHLSLFYLFLSLFPYTSILPSSIFSVSVFLLSLTWISVNYITATVSTINMIPAAEIAAGPYPYLMSITWHQLVEVHFKNCYSIQLVLIRPRSSPLLSNRW